MKIKDFRMGLRIVKVWLLPILLLCVMFAGVSHAEEKPEIFPQLGQSGWIQRVAMSNDGKYLLTGDFAGSIMLWDARTGREIRKFSSQSHIEALAFTPDGKHAVSNHYDAVKLWDLQTGQEIYTSKKKNSAVTSSIFFLSNGRYFMAFGFQTPVHVWETATGREVGGLSLPDDFHKRSGTIIVSPGSRYVLTQLYERVKMRQEPAKLWDLLTGKVVRELNRAIPYYSVFTKDGSKILSARYEDNNIELWDASTERVFWSSKGHTKSLDYIAVSESGAIAVSASKDDGTMRVWDMANGSQLQMIALPKGFKPIILSPDGKKIVLLDGSFFGDHKTARLYDTMRGRVIKSFSKEECESMSFTPDGRLLLVKVGKVAIWDAAAGRNVQSFEGSGEPVMGMTFAAKQNVAAIIGGKNVSIWDVAAGRRVTVLKGHEKVVSSAVFSPGTTTLATGSLDNTVRIWDLKTGRQTSSLHGHAGGVVSVAYSPDGRYIASAGNDALVKLWDSTTGVLLKSLTGHIQMKSRDINKSFTGIYNVAFSSDGKRLVSCGTDGAIKLWDVIAGKEIRNLQGQKEDVTAVGFSPDGRSLVSGGLDGKVRIWDADSGKEIKTLGKTEFGSVDSVSYSPDGRYVSAYGHDEISYVWEVASGNEVRRFSGTKTRLAAIGIMNSTSFSPDSRFLLTNDGFAAVSRLWDIASGRELVQFISFNDGEWIAYTPEGYFNASADGARHLNVRVGLNVYGIDQFFSRYFRPELVQLALAGKEIPKGELITDIASRKPAPVVQIISPAAQSSVDRDSVTVTIRVKDAGGGIGAVNIYLNGTQVANETRSVIVKGREPADEKTLSFTIPLVQGKNDIRAVAFNKENSMESNPALISVFSKAVIQKPNLYALVIGINEYKNKSISLNYAVTDAMEFAKTLKMTAAPLFEKTNIEILTTPAMTTKEAIIKAFEEMRIKVKPNDLFVFYDASHGIVDVVDNEEQYFLLTSNVLLLSSRHVGKDAMGQKELAKLIGSIPAQKKVVILDTCNAGKGGKEIQVALLQQTRGLTDSTAVKLLQRAIGSAVFSASSDSQLALEGYKGHGLFTFVLLEGLRGKADIKKDGYITVLGLADYVEENVIKLSEEVFKRQQTPTIQTGANFPIGKVK